MRLPRSTSSTPSRGLVILLFDTLRQDFRALCDSLSIQSLPSFESLARLCVQYPYATCGSFPTVPMRTDLLTGELAFLDRRWANPLPDQPTFTRVASEVGIQTSLVTDSYVLLLPEIGGHLATQFDDVLLLRGQSADPWGQNAARPASTLPVRPSRSQAFDAQFLANVANRPAGSDAIEAQLFEAARHRLKQLLPRGPFILWVDCFATHEPWLDFELVSAGEVPDDEPFFPPYGEVDDYLRSQLPRLRRRYAERVRSVDGAMRGFVDTLMYACAKADTGLAVLSDHGFQFGEYGLAGKGAGWPIHPQCFRNLTWLSPNLAGRLPALAAVQPWDVTYALLEFFGLEDALRHPCPFDAAGERPQLIGRNSPDAPCLTINTARGHLVVYKDSAPVAPEWYPVNGAGPFAPGDDVSLSMRELLTSGLWSYARERRWLDEFAGSLGGLLARAGHS